MKKKCTAIAMAISFLILPSCSDSSTSTSSSEKGYTDASSRIKNEVMNGEELVLIDAPSFLGWDKVSSGTDDDESNYWYVTDVPNDVTIVFFYKDDQNLLAEFPDGKESVDDKSGVSCILEDGVAKFRTPDMAYNCSSIWAIEGNDLWLVWKCTN